MTPETRKSLAENYSSPRELQEAMRAISARLDDMQILLPTDSELLFLDNEDMKTIEQLREALALTQKLLFSKKLDFHYSMQ